MTAPAITTPTLARDGFRLEADGWGDFGRVPVALEDGRPVCSACWLGKTTPLFVVHTAAGFPAAVALMHRLVDLGYRVRLEALTEKE